MTAVILPGQEFEIEVDGVKYQVKALSGKGQLELAQRLQRTLDAERINNVVEAMEGAKSMLDYVFGKEKSDQLWDESVDSDIAVRIAQKVFNKVALDEDEIKNSDSPP